MKIRRRKITEADLDPIADAGATDEAPVPKEVVDESALAPVPEQEGVGDGGDDYLALAQRTQADFDNFRKRARAEAETASERGVASLARELAPALDNLDHAVRAVAEQESSDSDNELTRGLSLVRDEFLAAFSRCGIELDHPEGAVFDPKFHEAVAHVPTSGVAPGVVVEVHQSGYRVGGTLIRPARVSVAQAIDA